MAKRSPPAKDPSRRASEKPSLLPLPPALFEHHGKTISQLLLQWEMQKHVPPVLLITGPAGVGKRSMVYFLSQWLLCEKSAFRRTPIQDLELDLFGGLQKNTTSDSPHLEQPCGECTHCQKAVKGHWVDFTEIAPGDGEVDSSNTLKIEQFRPLKASLGFGAFEGAFRIILIRDADRMTPQAANSLLKILEEPPAGWIFFLTVVDPSLLLPTLVSRCQKLRLTPFSPGQLQDLLKDHDLSDEQRSLCANLAQGSWSKALTLASDENLHRRESIFQFLKNPHEELNSLLEWAAQEPSHLELLLNQFEQIVLDLLEWGLDPTRTVEMKWRNSDGRKTLEAHAHGVIRKLGSKNQARSFWLKCSERLFRARQEASGPLNRKILIQSILLPWLEV